MKAARTALAALTALAFTGSCQPGPEPVRQPLSDPVIDPDDPVSETPVPAGVPSADEARPPLR